MPIRPQLAFGPIAKAIDTIVADAEKTESRLFQLRRDEQKRDQQESMFIRARNFQATLRIAGDKNATDETRKAAAGAIPKVLTDPSAPLVEPEFKPPEQKFKVSKEFSQFVGVPPGTLLNAAEFEKGVDNKRAQQTQDRLKEKDKAAAKASETKAQTAATEKAEKKQTAKDKKFVSDIEAATEDLERKREGFFDKSQGVSVMKGEGDEFKKNEQAVDLIDDEIDQLDQIERIARGTAEPESFEQVQQWQKKGFLSEERAIDMVEEFDLDATTR